KASLIPANKASVVIRKFRWLNSLQKAFMSLLTRYFGVMLLDVKLFVDGEKIDLNEFVVQILSGALVGAVTSLRGIKKDWKEIEVRVTR
ncbi:MAG: hypothetical protein JSV12_08570, partial [Candidatus Bathyarchaeota archaeon]